MDPAIRCCPRSIITSDESYPRSSGVIVFSTSLTGANPEQISDIGPITSWVSSASDQLVFIDIESLPTGMHTPSAGQNSPPTALTASYRRASSPSVPAAHIQLADNLICPIKPIAVPAIFMTVSATAIRADAPALTRAIGVRSPIAIASPVIEPIAECVTAQSATGTCQGPTI